MTNTPLNLPFYVKASLITIGLGVCIAILYVAQGIIIPLIAATIIAAAISPIVNFLVRKKINRVIAITLTLVLLIVVSASFVAILVSQASMFSETFPKLLIQLDQLFYQSKAWVGSTFNISNRNINSWIDQTNAELLNSSRAIIGQTLVNIGNVLVVLFLIPVYIFMILFYKPLLIEFIYKVFGAPQHNVVEDVLHSTKNIIQSYLVGLLLEALIVAILNSASLLILGIEYAILFGVIGAVLNVIPYLGGIIAVTLPMVVALATKSPVYALLVLGSYILIQLIDNNFIIPKVVGSKVRINALVSIIVVIIGGAIWGIPGMFLSIPLTAILKVIFDHIDTLKPWGYLLGDSIIVIKPKPNFTRRRDPHLHKSV